MKELIREIFGFEPSPKKIEDDANDVLDISGKEELAEPEKELSKQIDSIEDEIIKTQEENIVKEKVEKENYEENNNFDNLNYNENLGRNSIDTSVFSDENKLADAIFVKVRHFNDSKKIANFIKQDKIVTINLEEVDLETAQRSIDFLSGAMNVKGAKFVSVSKSIYVSIPPRVKVFIDEKKGNPTTY